MSASSHHKPKQLCLQHTQTLDFANSIYSIDMRIFRCLYDENSNKNAAAVIALCVGDLDGNISVYTSSLQHIHFTRQHIFHTHTQQVNAIHFHRSKPLFVSASNDKNVKVWRYDHKCAPRLITCLDLPSRVYSCRYSQSGLLLTGGASGFLGVYGEEPAFSVCWSFKAPNDIDSVAWSPSNRIAAGYRLSSYAYAVRIWDSSFKTIFIHKQKDLFFGNYCLAFPSDNLLISSGGTENKLYCCHMSTPKVMNTLSVLPFCRDVLKIVIAYLPLVTRVTHIRYPSVIGAVKAFSSQIMASTCSDNVLRVHKLHKNQLFLMARLPYPELQCQCLASCPYPGTDIGFVIAYSNVGSRTDVRIATIQSTSYNNKKPQEIMNEKTCHLYDLLI